MSDIKLVKPTIEYAEDIMKFRQELLDLGESFAGCGKLRDCQTAEEWLKIIDMYESEEACSKVLVPSSTYIAVRLSDNKIVGITDLRHHINHPVLSVWGGHIGYTIRPDERRKGYGKEMLRQNLQNCRNRGLNKVLITCAQNNIASEKTIIANGGIFEKEVEADGIMHKRYWIQL